MTALQTNEDDIIDLTELVEAGKTPVEEAESPQEQSLTESLPDIAGPLPGNLEGDIDSLLAQMEAAGADDSSQATPVGARPVVDPNEKIDMSGMMEVDNLLSSLNISPPPGAAPDGSPDAKEDSPPAPAKNSPGVDDLLSAAIDQPANPEASVLDDLLNDMLGTSAKTVKTPAPENSVPEEVVPEAPAMEAAEDADALLQSAGADGVDMPAPVVEADLTAPELPEAIPESPVDAAPIEQAVLIEQAVPIEQATPVEQVAPVEQAAPIEQTVPIEQIVPVEQTVPIEQAVPVEQVAPVAQETTGEEELAADLEALLASVGRPSASNIAPEIPEAVAPREADVVQPPVDVAEPVVPQSPPIQEILTPEIPLPETNLGEARFVVVENRLNDLEQHLSDMENRLPEVQPSVEENRLNDLEQRLSDMEDRLENTGRAGGTEQLEEMERRLTVLESRPIEVKCYQGSTDSRLIGLESRMDNLVLQFSERVEKAAASAAARILREELAALLRGGSGS